MIHHSHVTRVTTDTDDGLTVCVVIQRLPQGTPAPEQPPMAVDLPHDIHTALTHWLDPTGDQP